MVSEHNASGTMVTVKDMCSQVEEMEVRMGTLESGLQQELDELHSTVCQLNPEEIMKGMSKITHLERSISALDEEIQKIKKSLLVGGKNSASSSPPRFNPRQLESGYTQPHGERGKATHPAPQFMTRELEHLPRRLELPLFEGAEADCWIFRAE